LAQTPTADEEAKPGITPPSSGGILDELDGDSSDDPEALLAEAVPNLDKEMRQLQSDFIGLTADIESLDLGDDSPHPIQSSPSLMNKFKILGKNFKKLILKFGEKIFYRIKYVLIWIVIELPKQLISLWKNFSRQATKVFNAFSHWSIKRKISFFVTTLFIGAICFFYFKMVKEQWLYQGGYHFYGSMKELADHSFSYQPDDETEPFYNSPRVKVYSFKMKPLVVNLKRSENNENPMGFFEFVFEGNSGDVVVEFKSRESELVDLVSRVIERKKYDSLDTVEGKEELKEDIRKELNKKLLDGFIKKVEIHNFFIKP